MIDRPNIDGSVELFPLGSQVEGTELGRGSTRDLIRRFMFALGLHMPADPTTLRVAPKRPAR